MKIPMIIFVVVYLAVTVAYLFSETSGNFKRRAVNKIVLASLFLIYAVVETIRLGNPGGKLQLATLVGVIFCYIGDVVLLWSFSKGGASFCLGNIILFVCENLYFAGKGLTLSDYWYFLLIFAFLVFDFIYLVKTGWYDMPDKMGYMFSGYIMSVSLHGTLGIIGLFLLHDVKSVLFCAGLVLYMISDYFISLHKFKYKESKAILRLNSSSYFIGLMLVALSFSF